MTASSGSLRSRLRLTFAAAAVVTVLALLAGLLSFRGLLDARGRVIDEADPAALEAQRLLGALVDQETGVRAYVPTSEPSFLDPYRAGLDTEARSLATLHDLLRDHDAALEALAGVERASEQWHVQYADPTIDGTGGVPGDDADAQLAFGRDLFDGVRTAIGTLQGELSRERGDARDDLTAATLWLMLSVIAVALVVLVAVGALYGTVRRRVERPLAALGEDARIVSSGDLDHSVEPVGHTEFRELGETMELMRMRIVADVQAASEARDELERQAHELARSNAELEQFAYVASHDLQEPLRKVSAFCQLLQQRYGGQLDERADQYIDYAVDGAKRMQILINDLLSFSRVGRTSSSPPELIDAGELAATAMANLVTAIDDSGATVEVGALPAVLVERPLGVALFQNLIANGIKFARPGVAPIVRISAVERDGHHELTVADNGIGIEPAYAERVFVIFQRLHTKEAYPGTGIGLALCRKIVEHHGGTIWIDTSITDGCTVRFTLPVPDPESAAR